MVIRKDGRTAKVIASSLVFLISCNGINTKVSKTSTTRDIVESATRAVKNSDYVLASALLFGISLAPDSGSVNVPEELKKFTGGNDVGFGRTALAYGLAAIKSAASEDRKRILPYVLSEIELQKSCLVGPAPEIENIRLFLQVFYPLIEMHIAFKYRNGKDDQSFGRYVASLKSAQAALHDCGVHSETVCAALGEFWSALSGGNDAEIEKQANMILDMFPNDLTNIDLLKSAVVEKNAEASRMSTSGGDVKAAIKYLIQSATISLFGWLISGDQQLAQYFTIAVSEILRIS